MWLRNCRMKNEIEIRCRCCIQHNEEAQADANESMVVRGEAINEMILISMYATRKIKNT